MNRKRNFKPAGRTRMLGVALCLCVMLAANIAQALDSCELNVLRSTRQVQAEHIGSSAPAFCLICVAAHSSSLAVPAASVHPVASFVVLFTTRPRVFHLSPHILPLYIRPPPAI